jgi:hypothetical protein
MQTAIRPANDATVSNPGDQTTSLISIVADMMSLIVHVQASARLIEAAIRSNAEGNNTAEASNVIVLDDVAPCYARADAALSACSVGLDAALQSLLGTLAEVRPAPQRAVGSH